MSAERDGLHNLPPPSDLPSGEIRIVEGPIPSADELARLEAIAPGIAPALINLYAEDRRGAIARADRLARARERRRTFALFAAFVLAVLTGFGGIDALSQGDTATGITLSGGSLSALVLAFLRATGNGDDG